MRLQASSALTLLFVFLSYVIPIFGGWWADVHVGRYKAIMVGVVICGVAHVIQIIGAIPSVLQKGPSNAAPPFILGLLILAIGAGIFKPNVSPMVLDQIRQTKPYTKQLKSGEKVIVDPDAKRTRIKLIFYGFINIGALFMLATTYAEKYVGFWLSFLLMGIIYLLLPILLLTVRNRIHKQPPSGGHEITQAFKITTIALKQHKFQVWSTKFWDAANPDTLRSKGITVDWTRDAVNDVARTLGKSTKPYPARSHLPFCTRIYCSTAVFDLSTSGTVPDPISQNRRMRCVFVFPHLEPQCRWYWLSWNEPRRGHDNKRGPQ